MKKEFISEAILDKLAREVLMVNAKNESLTDQYAEIMKSGLPEKAPADKKDVLIIGAGIAGLIAGKLLKDAGYNVTILEANDNRVGGRVKTFHTTSEKQPFANKNQYGEAGAMRIPQSHVLVNQLISQLGLDDQKQQFYNVDVSKHSATKQEFHTWYKTNNVQERQIDYNNRKLPKDKLTLGFPVEQQEWIEPTASALLNQAFAPLNALIDKNLPIEQQVEGWKKIIAEYDNVSVRDFMLENFKDNEIVIQYIGTLQNLTSRSFLSILHMFIDSFYINTGETYHEIRGGNYKIPEALAESVKDNIVFNARAMEIEWAGEAEESTKAIHKGRKGVWVKTINEPGKKRGVERPGYTRQEAEYTADYLIITIPFSSLRFVEVSPMFSYHKRRAIIELHYDSATKVLLEFSERFWEWDEKTWAEKIGGTYRGHNSIGGGSVTDNPNRNMYFPSHKVEGSDGGVILASYTWADDAIRWDSIPGEDRYSYALKGLVDLYGEGIKKYYTGRGQTQSWMEDFYAMGEAAVFAPGQITELHPYIPGAEGNVFFAGEHTSLKHAWIEGALESGIRTAIELMDKSNA